MTAEKQPVPNVSDLLQFGPLDLSKPKLPQPYFTGDTLKSFADNLNKIPGLRDKVENLKGAQAITLLLTHFADVVANGPQPHEDTERITAMEAEIARWKDRAEKAETKLEEVSVSFTEQLEAGKTSLTLAEKNYTERQQLVDQLETKVGNLQKQLEESNNLLETFKLEETQIVVNCDPQMMIAVKQLLPEMVRRGWVAKGDDPSVFFNKAAWEFIRIFFGIELQPAAKPQPQQEQP